MSSAFEAINQKLHVSFLSASLGQGLVTQLHLVARKHGMSGFDLNLQARVVSL